MIKKNRGRELTIDQAEARSLNSAKLQHIKKSPSKIAGYFSPNVKFLYDRKLKRVILGGPELCSKPRFIPLSIAQAMVLRVIQKDPEEFKERIVPTDIATRIKLKRRNKKTIEKIMRALTKNRILAKRKLTFQGQTIEIFKLR